MESRYAIVTLAILIPEGIETEAEMRAYLQGLIEECLPTACTADALPEDGERWH